MKSVTIASTIAALAAIAAASPTPGWHGGGWKDDRKPYLWSPFDFTSTYHVIATPDQVINNSVPAVPTPGQPGAIGFFNYGINSDLDVICYNITLLGVTGDYQSAAKTATHIHQAKKGATGPARIAFPNPVGDDKVRRSVGCLTGPFTTGLIVNGADTGAGFKVKQIEQDPTSFFTDAHTKLYVPGVVRGQLA